MFNNAGTTLQQPLIALAGRGAVEVDIARTLPQEKRRDYIWKTSGKDSPGIRISKNPSALPQPLRPTASSISSRASRSLVRTNRTMKRPMTKKLSTARTLNSPLIARHRKIRPIPQPTTSPQKKRPNPSPMTTPSSSIDRHHPSSCKANYTHLAKGHLTLQELNEFFPVLFPPRRRHKFV